MLRHKNNQKRKLSFLRKPPLHWNMVLWQRNVIDAIYMIPSLSKFIQLHDVAKKFQVLESKRMQRYVRTVCGREEEHFLLALRVTITLPSLCFLMLVNYYWKFWLHNIRWDLFTFKNVSTQSNVTMFGNGSPYIPGKIVLNIKSNRFGWCRIVSKHLRQNFFFQFDIQKMSYRIHFERKRGKYC